MKFNMGRKYVVYAHTMGDMLVLIEAGRISNATDIQQNDHPNYRKIVEAEMNRGQDEMTIEIWFQTDNWDHALEVAASYRRTLKPRVRPIAPEAPSAAPEAGKPARGAPYRGWITCNETGHIFENMAHAVRVTGIAQPMFSAHLAGKSTAKRLHGYTFSKCGPRAYNNPPWPGRRTVL
jgi:hypothetical protein